MKTTINMTRAEAGVLRATLGSVSQEDLESAGLFSVYRKLNDMCQAKKLEYIMPSSAALKLTKRPSRKEIV